MKRTNILNALIAAMALPLLYLADVSHDESGSLILVRKAHAVVGAPLTPMSAAGVARRTTARTVTATTAAASQQQAATAKQQAAAARPAGAPPVGTVVNALPAGCKAVISNGVEHQNCGGVFYRSAFQGNNLVYVVE